MKKKIIDVHVGDIIIGEDGKKYKVINETDVHIPTHMYKISFSNNGFIECSGDHHWRYWYNNVDVLTDTYDLYINKEFFIQNKIQFGVNDSNIYLVDIIEIQPKYVKCIEVNSPNHMFLGYTSNNNQIFLSNCGFRAFAGRATETGASMVALDNTLATTIDNTYPGAAIVQSAGVPVRTRVYFSKFEDLQEYYRQRGLDEKGYSPSERIELNNNDSTTTKLDGGNEEIIKRNDSITFEFEKESVEIDKRQDQDWNEV